MQKTFSFCILIVVLFVLTACQQRIVPVQIASTTASSQLSQAPAPTANQLGDPREQLGQLIRFLNQHDFEQAYQMWDVPPESSLRDFQARFNQVALITATLDVPTYGAGLGSSYAQVPSELAVQYIDGSVHHETGCTILYRANPYTDGAPKSERWCIDSSLTSVALLSLNNPALRNIIIGSSCTPPPSDP